MKKSKTGKEREGIILAGVGSGGANILSRAYAEYEPIRDKNNCCYLINSSTRDYELRVGERFKAAGIEERPDNFQMRVLGEGYGAGKDVETGLSLYGEEHSAIRDEIKKLGEDYNFVVGFTVGCLGGGFGTLTLGEISKDISEVAHIPVFPIATLPRRGEGETLISNAVRGLKHLRGADFSPILYDNERASEFSQSVKAAHLRANRVIADTIAGLVDTVEYRSFAIPPIDIKDLTKVVRKECATFTSMRTEDIRILREWEKYVMNKNLSLESKPINGTAALCTFQGPEFPKKVVDDVSKYLRYKFKTRDLIPPTLEDEAFRQYSITGIIYGMSIGDIRPSLEPMKSWRERLFS